MTIEAMKQWREALVCALSDDKPYIDRCKQAITSIDQAIAEYVDLDAICQSLEEKTYTQAMRIAELEAKLAEAEKQEPEKYALDIECERCGAKQSGVLTVHTHPQPKREPLTDEQIAEISVECATVTPSDIYFARAIEAAHGIKEKNT